jgi:hypothetical protein
MTAIAAVTKAMSTDAIDIDDPHLRSQAGTIAYQAARKAGANDKQAKDAAMVTIMVMGGAHRRKQLAKDPQIAQIFQYFGIQEAKYHGREVKLGKPIRTNTGSGGKFKVYVRDPKTGNIKMVRFGDTTGLSIKRDDPKRRKSFRARHHCDNPGPRTKARYWSCRMWTRKPVGKILKGK